MKKIFTTVLLIAICILSVNAQKTYALITGVSNYEGNDHDLAQSTKDAKNIANLYKSKGATVIVITSKYATKDNVLGEIRKLANTVKSQDRIVFFYSGHGSPNTICTYSENGSPMLSYGDLFTALDKCNAKDIICFVDACFSGTAVQNMHSKGKYTLFLSSRQNETSGEHGMVGAGYFTNATLKGLRGKADANGDKKITSMELFKYIHADVQQHNKDQHPQLVTSKAMYDNVLMTW